LIRVAFGSLGQKQRVFESYSLSLSSMVAAAIYENLGGSNIAVNGLTIGNCIFVITSPPNFIKKGFGKQPQAVFSKRWGLLD
jgi:hypothetical protein